MTKGGLVRLLQRTADAAAVLGADSRACSSCDPSIDGTNGGPNRPYARFAAATAPGAGSTTPNRS